MKRLVLLVLLLLLFTFQQSEAQTVMKVVNERTSYLIGNLGENEGIKNHSLFYVKRISGTNLVTIGIAEVLLVKQSTCGLKIQKRIKGYSARIGDYLVEVDQGRISFDEIEAQDKVFANTESWYTYWGLGYSVISYPTEIQSAIDAIEWKYNPTRVTINIDMFGFYWHVSPKMIGGFVISGTGDRYDFTDGSYFQINQYLYGFSVQR